MYIYINVARVAGDVYFAESDGSFTSGRKAVGLSQTSLPATPPPRVTRQRSTSTVALPSVSPRVNAVTVDRYGGRDWPHDAQPRDTQDLTPPPPSPSPDPNMVPDTQVDEPEEETPKGSSRSVSKTSLVKGEKFDKYYHQTFSSTISSKTKRCANHIYTTYPHMDGWLVGRIWMYR